MTDHRPADDDDITPESPLKRLTERLQADGEEFRAELSAEGFQTLAALNREQLLIRLGLGAQSVTRARLEQAEAQLTQVREWIRQQLARGRGRADAAEELSRRLGWTVTDDRDSGPYVRPDQVIHWREAVHDVIIQQNEHGTRDIVGGPDDVTGNSS